jgi:hypothetical protein
MNDDLYLEYLLQMGAMSPDEEKLARRQARVDALREKSMQTPTGEMVGKHYVAPSWTQYAAQLGNAFMANRGQKQVDDAYGAYNKTQGDAIRALQQRMAQRRATATGTTPPSMVPPSGTMGVKRPWSPDEDEYGMY